MNVALSVVAVLLLLDDELPDDELPDEELPDEELPDDELLSGSTFAIKYELSEVTMFPIRHNKII
jgi:hypothetical protein